MATTAKKIVRRAGRRPKADVEKEFTQLQVDIENERLGASPKMDELAKLRGEEVRQAVDGVTVEGVVQRISALGLDVSKALAGLSEQLAAEVERLNTIREAVAIEEKELERLHKLDVAATALDQLVDEYSRRKQELEQEIEAQRAAWEEESRTAERERKEAEENLKKQRQREIEDYEYKKALERKKAQDKYEEEQRIQERKNQEKQEVLEKGWQQREAALKEREEELARLRKESEQFPSRLQKEVERAAEEAARQAEVRFEQQTLVMKKDAEADKRLAELRIKTLEDLVAQQSAQIAALEKQLAEAKKQVQEIAVKAIEGASGARALAHVNEIAIEQAKHRSPPG
jgi:hypothetical protein